MSIPVARTQIFDYCETPLVIEPSPGQFSGDTGLLPIREFDHCVGLPKALSNNRRKKHRVVRKCSEVGALSASVFSTNGASIRDAANFDPLAVVEMLGVMRSDLVKKRLC